MNEYPLPPQQPGSPPSPQRRQLPRWALVGGLSIACALLLGLGALIGATLLPALGASATANGGQYAQFAQAGPKGTGVHAPGHGPGRGLGRALTVSSVGATTISATTRSGATVTINTTASTTYTRAGKTVDRGAITKGTIIGVQGTRNSDGSVQATAVHIVLPHAGGKITAIASDKTSVTVQNPRDTSKTVTIHLSGTTTYTTITRGTNGPTQTPASVNDLAVGGYTNAVGTKNSDGSLNAEAVRILPGAPAGHHGGRHGPPPATPSTTSTTGG